ncbi:hypothetical protein R3P38DRAFT_2765566 [Favolaschia claudopus]|uniref:Uncharacterized protein n=1 Tax=Favolaschia claudopus TaxID=2862362 RepID=A0AAW0D5V4_9AGAR
MGIDGGHEEARGVGLGERPAVIVFDIETKSLFTVCGTISRRVGDGQRDVGETMSALVVELMVLGRMKVKVLLRKAGGGSVKMARKKQEILQSSFTNRPPSRLFQGYSRGFGDGVNVIALFIIAVVYVRKRVDLVPG